MKGIIKSLLFFWFPKNKFLNFESCEFVFLANSRTILDVKKNIPQTKFIPDFLLEKILFYLPPIIFTKVRGLHDKNKQKILGYIVICPMTGKSMLKNKKKARKKVIQGVKLSKKLNAKTIGLGAFTSSVTNGGLDLVSLFPDITITNGNTYTAAIALEDINFLLQKYNLKNENLKIAIIGATGSIGSVLSEKLVNKYFQEIFLIGKNKNNIQKLEDHVKTKINKDNNTKIQFTNNLQDVIKCDLIIMATASSGVVLDKNNIKKKAIIYNISQPSNIHQKIKNNFIYYEGGLVCTPNIKHRLSTGLNKETNFACFTETMLLASEQTKQNFLGHVKADNLDFVIELSRKQKFSSALINNYQRK